MARSFRIILIALIVAFIAMAGTANALRNVSVSIDKVQANGHYLGVPTIMRANYTAYGYIYTFFVPDGTYTVFGTITSHLSTPVQVRVGGGANGSLIDVKVIDVPAKAAGEDYVCVGYTLDFFAGPKENVSTGYWVIVGVDNGNWTIIDLDSGDFVNATDDKPHTFDQGPMSDATAVYVNNALNYNGTLQFRVSVEAAEQ